MTQVMCLGDVFTNLIPNKYLFPKLGNMHYSINE